MAYPLSSRSLNNPANNPFAPYLAHSTNIDWRTPSIQAKAAELATSYGTDCNSKVQIAKACFEFVRDGIKHSMDFSLDGTTCKASDVLANGHGFCYAKSHLLAALLRANDIPTALCYQRLTIADFPDDNKLDYCLHGLNAVYLPNIMNDSHNKSLNGKENWAGWYRIDPRGNKAGVDAQFCPPLERLAFCLKSTGERNITEPHGGLFAEPLPCVTRILETHNTCQAVADNLPDITLLT